MPAPTVYPPIHKPRFVLSEATKLTASLAMVSVCVFLIWAVTGNARLWHLSAVVFGVSFTLCVSAVTLYVRDERRHMLEYRAYEEQELARLHAAENALISRDRMFARLTREVALNHGAPARNHAGVALPACAWPRWDSDTTGSNK